MWTIMIIIIAIVIAITIASIFFKLFFVIVRENEMGAKITLGKIGKTVDSGIRFLPFTRLIQKIAIFPTSQQSFRFVVPTAVTKRGRVKGYSNIIESINLNVHCTVYYNFDKDNLKKTIKNAPGPTEKQIGDAAIPELNAVFRAILGRVPWRLINEERFKFSELLLSRVYHIEEGKTVWRINAPNDENDKTPYELVAAAKDDPKNKPLTEKDLEKSPFVQFGLKNVLIAIENIDSPDGSLEKAIAEAENASLLGEAKIITAKALKKEKIELGQGDAEARKAMIDVIKEEKDLEALQIFGNAMSSGKAVFYELPKALNARISTLFSEKKPDGILEALSEKDKQILLGWVKNGIKEKDEGGA